MKNFRIFALILAIILLLSLIAGAIVPAFGAQIDEVTPVKDDPTVSQGSRSPDGAKPVHGSSALVKSASSAILYEVTSDTLVYAWHPDTRLSPSSLTKIMTAMLAIELGNMNDLVTVTWNTLEAVPQGALVAGLVGDELLTMKELVYLLMVGSANDAAVVIAQHIAGSQRAFVELMNQRAEELGCTDTNFVNTHGLHHDQQVTTARDMVKILRQAMQYDFFMEVFGAPNYTLQATNKAEDRTFRTTNYMASQETTMDYYDERVTGGRTGNTDEGHRNLAVTAEQDGIVYIAVVLEAKSEYASNGQMLRQGAFEDAKILLDLGYDHSSRVQVLYEGQVVEQLQVLDGVNDVVIGPQETVTCVLPADVDPALITNKLSLHQAHLTAPVEAGAYIGDYLVYYNGLCVASVPLYTKNSSDKEYIPQPENPVQPPENGFDAGAITTAFWVLGILLAVILAVFGGMILMRKFRSMANVNRNRKRRQERRRSR